jgi:streptogramin lyase/mono/diheme cytochrome c family protein
MAAGLAVLGLSAGTGLVAQQSNAKGTISGTVTADRQVRGLRVKARDTEHRINYVVFTRQGRYQITNLPAASYDVQVLEADFDSPVQTVTVAGGGTATANLVLKGKSGSGAIGAGAAQAAGQEGYRGSAASTTAPSAGAQDEVELVDFDTLYPPSHARDVLLKNCFGCHGLGLGWHNRGRRTENQWRTAVERMFRPDHRIADLTPGVPLVTSDRVSNEDKEAIVKYLTANFGPNSNPKKRDLKMDTLVRDEDALSKVMFIQYDVPVPDPGNPFPNTNKKATGGLHDVHVSPSMPGVVWLTGNQSNSIVKVDTKTLDFMGRTQRWFVTHPKGFNTIPHGLIEENGKVYWAELAGDRIGELDPKTGQIRAFRLPTEGGGAHTLRADSKGNIWTTYYAATGKVARVNIKSGEVKEFDLVKSFSGYGMTVDKQDRAWFVGLNTAAVFGYDPKTEKITSYPISNPARRPAVDHKGNVWAAQFFGNKIAQIDPSTGKVTEFDLPLRFGNPYELIADSKDNIWVENGAYSSIVKFEPTNRKFTYIPFPEIKATTVKFEVDRDDTIWFVMPYGGGRPSGLTGMKILK